MASVRRPEHQAPPDVYYNDEEARKYTQNSRVIEVQERCTERALELLALPEDVPALLLDLGCGSGLSGETITENGHMWIGLDISQAMLDVAIQREVEGDVMLRDLGQGAPFRAGMFDGAISISTIQWLCNADKSHHSPAKRLYKFFMTLYACLARGSRSVFQFYPENDAQVELIISQAMRAGFTGGLVVDYPNSSKAKKVYLVLMTGGNSQMPSALGDEDEQRTQALYQRSETPTGPRNKKSKTISIQQELVNIEKEKMEWFKKATEEDDDADKHFLLSLLPQMKSLPPEKLSELKLKYITLLHEAAYVDTEQ